MLAPRRMMRNPVMFVTEIGAALTTIVGVQAAIAGGERVGYFAAVAVWLWLTVLFANFSEALAEARGRAQADTLRATRRDTPARRLVEGREETVSSRDLAPGDLVVVAAGEVIPGDGEVVAGIASVDESAITGESAAVIREAGGDRSGVTGGTRVLSDEITVRVTARPGESFLDRIIALVEGAKRQKSPNEIALTIVLAGFTLAFLTVTATLHADGPLLRDRPRRADPGRAARLPDPDDDRRPACPPSGWPAWTGRWPPTSSPRAARRWNWPATSTPCCSTRPGRSPSATGGRPSSCPSAG